MSEMQKRKVATISGVWLLFVQAIVSVIAIAFAVIALRTSIPLVVKFLAVAVASAVSLASLWQFWKIAHGQMPVGGVSTGRNRSFWVVVVFVAAFIVVVLVYGRFMQE